jgi:transcriptional regulator with XRE-family HTH domain
MGNQGVLEARVEADLTQVKLAEKAGVAVQTVVRAERGIRISALSEARIARVLGVPRTRLFPEQEQVG